MSLIDSSYSTFTNGSYKILLQDLDSDVFDDVCERVEQDILTKLFGDVMYLDFEQNLDDADYLELIEGYKVDGELAPYELQSKKYVYRGLKDMLAYFTYFYFIQGQFNYNPGQTNSENKVEAVNPMMNSLKAYNLGVKLYNDAYRFIVYKQSVYSTLFPDWKFTIIEQLNSFDI